MQLVGKYVSLEKTDVSEANLHLEYLNDDETMEHLSFIGPGPGNWTLEAVKSRLEKLSSAESELVFSIWTDIDHVLVGQCGLKNIDLKCKTAEFGIIVHKAFWGLPYAAEATFLSLDHAFRKLLLHRISFATSITNIRARRFIASLGAVGEGIMRDSLFLRDKYVDQLLSSLLADDWPGGELFLRKGIASKSALLGAKHHGKVTK